MKTTDQIKRILSALLVFVLVISLVPVNVFAASSDPIVLIAGGDYQQAGDHANSSDNVTNILETIVAAGLNTVDGFLFIGDYDCETHDDASETAAGITSLMNTMTGVYSNLNNSNTILVQGNHDYPDSRIDASGGHTFDGYSVFVMNEDDYPNYGGSESQAKSLSAELDDFLADKLAQGYTAPIFVTSHVPLHFGPRTNVQGDGKYGKYYFDVMNAYGAEGLNIIFMHGHNHAYGYDEYIGGEAIYLAVGDQINIAKSGSQSSYTTETLNFTYMNAGYTGYYNESGYSTSSGTDFLTMTTFQIYDDKVVINRYSEDGLYNMKSVGEKKGNYINNVSVSANAAVYPSAQTITLTAPAERITLKDASTGVTVTGLKVDGIFDDHSDLTVSAVENIDILDNAAKCAAYQAYDLTFTNSGTVSIALPVPETYAKNSTKVYSVNGNSLTQVDASISDTTATFTATSGGTYAVVSEVTGSTGGVSYERVESVSDLVSGEQYLIIFDCSSQTTADAIVMPEIATYSSGSSKRMGPDVLVSDGIADEETITGNYDSYLWTLNKSGSGWLIGNGSQNINVTYSSTSSRCELDFTTSGEALTIAAASSNPSDADSYSYAICDNSGYYWQYNTSATLIYGTDGDGYTSRFHFYKRAESTATTPDVDNGWVSLPSGGTYTLDTDGIDIGENHKYIIVGNNNDYALTLSGGAIGQTAVTVNGNTISVDDPSIYEFYFADNSSNESSSYLLTQDGTNTVYHANGNMYYGSDNKGYWHFGSRSNGSYQIYDNDNSSWYLNYGYVWSSETANRFAVSSRTRYVRLYKSTNSVYDDTYIRLAGETEQTYTATTGATEEAVLKNVSIEITTDGYHVSETVAVTADMVTWNKAFDGTAADTYTGTVTYGEEELGTITVTITAEEHAYETVTVEATCTEAGSITTKCTICGEETVEVIEALGHKYDSVVTDATCGKDGSKVYTCTVCEDTYTETIPATGNHSYESVTVDATCAADGSVTYTCVVCDDSYVESIPATGDHAYEAVTVDATCIAAGSVTYTCAVCGDSYSKVIEATGHSYTCVVTEATCTEDGSSVYTCTVCGDSYTEVITATGHNYVSVVTGATCTEGGFTTYTCSGCGDSYVADHTVALGHRYETATVDATCTTDGSITYYCAACGDIYTETIVSTGHSYQTVVTAPTCDAEGYTTHTCTSCGDSYVTDHAAALGHNYDTVTVDPTCTVGGYTTYTCTVCGHGEIYDETAPLGHDYVSVTVDPTETEGGYTTYTCNTCGHSYTDNYVDALGHAIVSIVTEATCTTEGYTTHTCTTCGEVTVDTYVPALGHNYQTVTVEATCTTDGSVSGKCTTCGDEYYEVSAAYGHNYTASVTAPTCTEGGHTVYSCDRCGDNYVDNYTEALGHNYTSITTDVTCTEDGYTTHLCTNCGDSYVGDTIEALGHNYQVITADATCTENGSITHICSNCGDSYAEEIPAIGHNYQAVVTEPTCTAEGYTTYTCANCGNSYAEVIAATGHDYQSVVTVPTCTEGGYTTHTCADCGDSYVNSYTNVADHSYTCVESDGYLVYTCDNCGSSYSEKIENLTYTRVSSISSGDNYVITLYSGRKYYALSHEDNEISVVQVTVSNKEITSEITEDLVWTYSNKKLSYEDGDTTYYLYAGSSSNNWWGNWWGSSSSTLSLSTSNSSTVSFSNSKLKVGSKYLRYSNGSISLNSSATTTYCFIEE